MIGIRKPGRRPHLNTTIQNHVVQSVRLTSHSVCQIPNLYLLRSPPFSGPIYFSEFIPLKSTQI